MLSDKQIQEISKVATQVNAATAMGIFISLRGIIGILPYNWTERLEEEKRCKQWLFDNQQSYPFSITKEDMVQ